MNKELQRKAVELYIRVKGMYILAEETTPGFMDFLQPVFEINRGFDHMSRVIAAETGLTVPQQFPLQNDLTYSNYYKLPKIVYDENFNSLILQQKIYLRKTNNINMLDFRFVNLFKQNTVISTG